MPSRTPARLLTFLPLEDRTTPAVAYALSGTNLLGFDTTNPTVTTSTAITGVDANETLVGIDFRPQNGLLYGLGVYATANTATLYAVSTRTGVATAVGTSGGIAFVDGSSNPIDLPDPTTVGYGFDFNPAVDRVRVVAGGLNFRVNPNTGAPVDGDTSTPATVNPDGAISGGTNTVDATAYTNNMPNNGGITTQYTLDATTNSLFIQNPPNAGPQTQGQVVTLSGNPLDFTAVGGFDIPAGVNVPTSNAGVTAGSGFAVLNVGGTTALYAINLTNGVATLLGNVDTGTLVVSGFAVQSDLGGFPAVSVDAAGANLMRFNTATPGTVTTQAVAGLIGVETLVAVDYRAATGQLYALGFDPTNMSPGGTGAASLYIIDPQTGAATVVGAPGAIAGAPATTVNLTGVTAFGFDFNPTVDRIRITTNTGLNLRVNPTDGTVVQDSTVNGAGVTGVTATAYTNSFGQSLTGGVTTLYTLDAASDALYIQNPPNNGTQTNPLPITLGGSLLDFTAVNGFDIPAGVAVTTSNSAAAGRGFAVLTVGGVTGLYSINLTTGEAMLAGAVGAGSTPLAGFALGDAPAGAVSFVSATTTVGENEFGVLLRLTRTSPNGTVSVTVTPAANGTASANEISLFPVTITFVDGQTLSEAFVSPILPDDADEPDETFTLTLSAPTGGLVLTGPTVQTVTILDDDLPPGAASFGAVTYSVNEGAGTLAVTLTRPPGSAAGTITIQFAAGTADGTDYTATPIVVSFAAGQTMATVNVPITSDLLDEADETFTLTLVSPTGGALIGSPATATATIVDDDATPTPTPPTPTPTAPAPPKMVVGTGGRLTVTNADGSTTALDPFPGFAGGFTVASGDVTGDGVADAIAGARAGGGSHVKVFDGATGALVYSFFAYAGYAGGVAVAAGDVNGDGRADIITGAGIDGTTGNGHVKVFDGATGALIRSFFAYPGFGGGVTVAAGDLDGDGFDDIVTGASVNGHVKVFSGATGAELRSFFAYVGFPGGVFVAAGDLDGDGRAEIVTGAGAGAPAHVKAFSAADNSLLASFFAYDTAFLGGVRVGVSDVNGDGVNDILTGPGPGGGPNVRAFALNGTLLSSGLSGTATTGVFVG